MLHGIWSYIILIFINNIGIWNYINLHISVENSEHACNQVFVNKVCCMSVDRDNTGIYTEGQYIKKQITNSQSRWKLEHIPACA